MPTTKVEDILKKIHIVFAKGKTIGDNPDRIVLSKSEMFALLEQLNEAMYEVLDKYEATTRSKEKAKLEMERQASEIVIKAKQDADDVHAASILYTDDMLAEVSGAIADVTEAMKREYVLFLQRMDERCQALQADRDEINARLDSLHDREFYLKTLTDLRSEEEDYDDDEEEAAENGGSETNEKENSSENRPRRKKHGNKPAVEPDEEWPEEEKPAPPVIRVNKPGENSGVQMSTRKDRKRKPVENNAPAGEKLSPEELENLSEEQLAALENSTPAYGEGFTAEDFPNLDAEYEQFKEEQGLSEGENSEPQKKRFLSFLSKKNKKK